MRKLLFDTSVYINAMRGEARSVALTRRAETILLSPIVAGELMVGFKRCGLERGAVERLGLLTASTRVEQLVVSTETAEFYALILAGLHKRRTPVPSNDIWIAASAMEHGAALASSDAHFSRIEGLYLITP